MPEITQEEIESQLEDELPSIEVDATIEKEALDITTSKVHPPLELKPGKSPPAVTGSVDEAEELKDQFEDLYFDNFKWESIPEEVRPSKAALKRENLVETLSSVAEKVRRSKTTKREARSEATKAFRAWIEEEYPREFEDATVGIEWQAREFRLSVRVVSTAQPDYVDYSFAQSGPMEKPGELIKGFQNLRKLLRKDLTDHPEITERMDYLRKARRARLEAGELDIEKLLFPAEEMRTINSISTEELTSITVMQGMVSKRLWAAQHVLNCEEGMSGVCSMVEDMVAAGPGGRINPSKWEALNEAWEAHKDGTFDAVSFVEEQVEFVSKEEEERKELLEAWPTIPAGWEPVSETEIERSDPDARIEIEPTDGRFRTRATIEGVEYEVREAVTQGGARTDARLLAEEINEKGYGLVSSSPTSESKEEGEQSAESKGGIKERIRERM